MTGQELSCASRKQAHMFGGRTIGQASKTFRIERVGDQRHRLFVHDVERCLSFPPDLEGSRPAVDGDEICSEFPDLEKLNESETEPRVVIAVHSDREEEIAGKEPERVPVEPETPDVVVLPAKQPQLTTASADSIPEPDPTETHTR